ncbi:MAG TPA: thioredoxin domain-containing protein [Phycisphaerales bacterium]|nr:thioredoxin domain-containing protein [Phycisphaerales bacterium]
MKNNFFCGLLVLGSAFLLLAGCRGDDPSTPTAAPAHRLERQNSPYLRQHADNTVAWYPWGEEAFQKAKREKKLIFLSIGYSTCHWCHVMEEESFMDQKIGDYLNQNFVAVKVDRETRPDVDAVYMTFVQSLNGNGGWPLNVFLTPERTPVYGGTYYPNPAKFDRPGFMEVLQKLQKAWLENPELFASKAEEIAQTIAQENEPEAGSDVPSEALLEKALKSWTSRFDSQYGGFLPAPKFPSPPDLTFLLRSSDPEAREMALKTLEAIALGGIHDHLEGGFHRYSTDPRWLVPHFEKMLYDQAQLMAVYAEAYALTQNDLFRQAVVKTDHYLEARLRSPQGAYYSAEDADSANPDNPSQHSEGAFYVWSYQELQSQLSNQELRLAEKVFGLSPQGNAENDPQEELKGKSILFLTKPLSTERERALVEKLSTLRKKRPRPQRDEKILTEWNAMTAHGYAQAGRYLNEPGYLQRSGELLKFLEERMVKDGRLQRSSLERSAEGEGFAIDYAQLIRAYLSLFEATGEPHFLQRSLHWQSELQRLFWDDEKGGFFDSESQGELPYRRKSFTDGATLSANSCALLNLGKLYAITGRQSFQTSLDRLLKLEKHLLERAPTSAPGALSAVKSWYGFHDTLLLFSQDTEWLRKVRPLYLPYQTLIPITSEENQNKLKRLIPLLPDWSGRSQAYACRGFACELPVEKLDKLIESLKNRDRTPPKIDSK